MKKLLLSSLAVAGLAFGSFAQDRKAVKALKPKTAAEQKAIDDAKTQRAKNQAAAKNTVMPADVDPKSLKSKQ